MKKLIITIAVAFSLMLSGVALAGSCAIEGTPLHSEAREMYEQQSSADVVKSCFVMAVASSPTSLWKDTCNCAENIKKHCKWSPKKGMKASGGISVGMCMVFQPFL